MLFRSVKYLQQALALDPEGETLLRPAHELRLDLARNLLIIGSAAAAQRELELLLETVPSKSRAIAYYQLGRARLAQGDSDGAEQAWQQALEHDRTDANSLAALGELELHRHNVEAALQYLEVAVQDRKSVV